MNSFRDTTQTCGSCRSTYTAFLPDGKSNVPDEEKRCLSCMLSADTPWSALQFEMMAAYYGVFNYELSRLQACLAEGHTRPDPNRCCLDCRIHTLQKDDGSWEIIHFRTFDNIARDYPGETFSSVERRAVQLGFPRGNIRSGG